MAEDLFITSYEEGSRRHAVFEDDGVTAWLYLHGPSADSNRTAAVQKACFVYNRKPPINAREVASYRPKPPPIATNYATEFALIERPSRHLWLLEWSSGGEAVLLKRDGEPWCLIEVAANQHGYCKSIKADGPWGSPWDQQRFESFRWRG